METHLGVLSACLPCMRPIFNFVVTGRFESRRGAGSTTGGSRSIRMGGGTWRNGTGNGVTGNRGFEALDTTKDSIIGKDGSVGSSQERITTETRVYATGKGSDGVTESELGGIVKEVKIDIR